jgi:hypothetical protein
MIVCRLGAGLQLRKLNSTQFVPLRGTTDAVEPFWAPDSQWIGFFVNGALMKMQVPDGAPELLWKNAVPAGGAWSRNGTILFGEGSGFKAIPATGGSAVPLPLPKPLDGAAFPHFLPDGEHFLFWGASFVTAESGHPESHFYLGAWAGGKWTLPPVPLTPNGGEMRYSPAYGGSVLFVRNDDLYAQKLDLARARLEGSPILVETNVAASTGIIHTDNFSVSAGGVLAWRPGRAYAEQLTWFDRHGNPMGTAGPPSDYLIARPSPDERRIAAIVLSGSGSALRVLDTGQSGFLTILNPDKLLAGFASVVWRRDSLHLLYTWYKRDGAFLTEQSANGNSDVRDLGKLPTPVLEDVAPDGALLMTLPGAAGRTLQLVPLEGDRTPRPLLTVSEQASQGAFSPDGRWVVYSSTEDQALFVQRFPISGPRTQISEAGGAMPSWRGDGREIVYLGRDSYVYSVRADPEHGDFHQPSERLFPVRSAPNSTTHRTLAISRDGSRILFNQAIDQPESRVINVVALRR